MWTQAVVASTAAWEADCGWCIPIAATIPTATAVRPSGNGCRMDAERGGIHIAFDRRRERLLDGYSKVNGGRFACVARPCSFTGD